MRKIWILVIAVIIFLCVYALYEPVKTTVNNAVFAAGGSLAVAGAGMWNAITASPIYQTYHPLIWLFGGIVLLYAFQRVLRPRIPRLRKTTPAYDISLQNEPPPSPPVIVKQTTEPAPEKEVTANA